MTVDQPLHRNGPRRPQETDAVVYIVDDDPTVCRALARRIRSAGLRVESFQSATVFLEQTPRDQPACLVLDIRLPGVSGLYLQSALTQAQRDIPIIFITSDGDVPSSVRAMKGGAVDFLQKPFNDQDLLDCVQGAIVRSRRQRADHAERADLERCLATLTPREREVMMLVVTGLLNKQVASELGIAVKTIKIHRGRVMEKMRARSVVDLVRMAQKLGQQPMR